MRAQLLVVLILFSGVCAATESIVLWYSEQEPGFEPERVRYIVTDRYMRSDDGGSENGFILLDRRQKKIFNIVPGTLSILEIDGNGQVPKPPVSLAIDVQEINDPDVPLIDGKRVSEIRVSSEEEFCYGAMVLPGHHDKVRQAFQEFNRILALRQSRTLEATPVEFRTDCFMIQYLYASGLHLKQGLPVREWSREGKTRQLVDFKTMILDRTLFELPADYSRYHP